MKEVYSTMSKNFAKQLLVYYIQQAWEAAGLDWDNYDNTAEVESIVDEIVSAIKDELAESDSTQ